MERELDGEDADAQTSIDGSFHDDLFVNNDTRSWTPEMQGTHKVMQQKIITTLNPCLAWSRTVMMVLQTRMDDKSICKLNQKKR